MKTDVHEVMIEVTVPAGTSEEAVTDMVTRMLNSAHHESKNLIIAGKGNDCTTLIDRSEYSVRHGCYDRSEGTDLECKIDVDEATYIGNEDDGVYYQTFEDDDGTFWMSAIVDCDTGGFVDSLVDADGPYDLEEQAEAAGRNAALEWCGWNDVVAEADHE